MSSQHFRIDEHKIEASHIRSFPRALATHENDVLHLAIKQYTPLINPNPQEGDITIIAAHANAFPKVSSSNIALNRTFQCISSLPSLKMLYQHGCVVSTADLTNVGTLRTTLGRASPKKPRLWFQDSQYLDRRCSSPRPQQRPQRRKARQRPIMAGPQSRPPAYGQHVFAPDASAHHRCRSLHGRLPTRKPCSASPTSV